MTNKKEEDETKQLVPVGTLLTTLPTDSKEYNTLVNNLLEAGSLLRKQEKQVPVTLWDDIAKAFTLGGQEIGTSPSRIEAKEPLINYMTIYDTISQFTNIWLGSLSNFFVAYKQAKPSAVTKVDSMIEKQQRDNDIAALYELYKDMNKKLNEILTGKSSLDTADNYTSNTADNYTSNTADNYTSNTADNYTSNNEDGCFIVPPDLPPF